MAYSPVPIMVATCVMTTRTSRIVDVSESDAADEARRELLFVKLFALFICGIPFSLICWMIYDSAVTREEVYTVQAKVYAFDLRTTGTKHRKLTDVVHVSVVSPNGVRSVHSTTLRSAQCPLVDMHTPVAIEVTKRVNKYDGAQRGWSARLLHQPCRMPKL